MGRLREDLVSIEQELWVGGPETYRQHLDDQCLIAFTQMAGVSSREDVARTVQDGERWRDLDIEVVGLLQPTQDVAILTYGAHAIRGETEAYHALVSSAYVKRGGAWKLAFHQQTPISD